MAKGAPQAAPSEDGDQLPTGFTLIRRTGLTHIKCQTENVIEALDRLKVTCLYCTYCKYILHPTLHVIGERR